MRQNKVHAARNKTYKNNIKQLDRELNILVRDGKKEEAVKLLPRFYKAVDKAAKKNIFHKNRASHKKGRAAKQVNALS